jgi:hypothetical protein
MKVILKGGPLDGHTDTGIRDETLTYRRHAKGAMARYKSTGVDDANGYHIFEHWPPKPGEPEPTEGVHDA